MKRYSQSFTCVVHLLLVIVLLLTFAAPAFAEGVPLPDQLAINATATDGALQVGHLGLSPEIQKAQSLQEHLSVNALGQLELNGTASDLGISETEYTLVLQFLQDINNGESVVEVESDNGEIVKVGTPDFARAIRKQHQLGNDEKASPDFALRYQHYTVYIYLSSSETWWIEHGATWIIAGLLTYIGARYGGKLGAAVAGSIAKAIGDLVGRYGPQRVDFRFPLRYFPWFFYIRYWGSRIHWINGYWIPL